MYYCTEIPLLKDNSREDTPLEFRTQILGIKYCEYMRRSLSLKDTPIIRTKLFSRRVVLIRGRLLY